MLGLTMVVVLFVCLFFPCSLSCLYNFVLWNDARVTAQAPVS